MEDKIATFGYITMENNEEELHQDQQLDIILTNVELADNMEKSQQDVEMSNEMNTMFVCVAKNRFSEKLPLFSYFNLFISLHISVTF